MSNVNARAFVLGDDKSSIHSQIIRAARLEKADLIVVGTHGRVGLSRLFSGSVASQIMAHAHCPVLVVGTHSATIDAERRCYHHDGRKKAKTFLV
jgi:hypothetical protein